jgi:hypothetical protein
VVSIKEYTLSNNSIKSGNCYIYVPNELLDEYKSAPFWSNYASQIRPLYDLNPSIQLIKRTLDGDLTDDNIKSIGKYAFANCAELDSVTFYAAETIGEYAFRNCTQLKTAVFHAAKTIDASIFSGCSSLTMVTFYNPVNIHSNVFSGCTMLDTLILHNSDQISSIGTNTLKNTVIASGSGYIYVPSVLIDAYKADSNWSAYSTQFRAIEDYPEICGGDR